MRVAIGHRDDAARGPARVGQHVDARRLGRRASRTARPCGSRRAGPRRCRRAGRSVFAGLVDDARDRAAAPASVSSDTARLSGNAGRPGGVASFVRERRRQVLRQGSLGRRSAAASSVRRPARACRARAPRAGRWRPARAPRRRRRRARRLRRRPAERRDAVDMADQLLAQLPGEVAQSLDDGIEIRLGPSRERATSAASWATRAGGQSPRCVRAGPRRRRCPDGSRATSARKSALVQLGDDLGPGPAPPRRRATAPRPRSARRVSQDTSAAFGGRRLPARTRRYHTCLVPLFASIGRRASPNRSPSGPRNARFSFQRYSPTKLAQSCTRRADRPGRRSARPRARPFRKPPDPRRTRRNA